MKIHQLNVDQALASLNTSEQGLSIAEAQRRKLEYGSNHIEEAKRKPLWLTFLGEFSHFFAIILWAAAAIAFVAEFLQPGQGMATLAWAILGVILINGLFSFWQQYRAEQAIAALRKLLPLDVKVVRDGEMRLVEAAELVPGDILLLQEGDRVPADCRLLESFSLRVNNATITGEAMAKARDAYPSLQEDAVRSKNILFAGTSVVSGEGKTLVYATGMQSEFGKIAHLTQAVVESLSPLQREIIRLSRLVAILATGLGLLFFLIGRGMGLNFWENFIFAIGIIVANVPEGLLPTVTLSLAMATQRMAKRNALIRHLPAVEALGAATVICTDKTGTLTQNRMSVKQLWLGGLGQVGIEDPIPNAGYRPLFENAALCHNLNRSNEHWVGDPMEVALVELAQVRLGGLPAYEKKNEIPFDTDRKRLTTVHSTLDGDILYCKGAPESVLPLCSSILLNGLAMPLEEEQREQIRQVQESMATNGLRVLAFAHRAVEAVDKGALERELIFSGLMGLEDPPRPEVPDALAKCREAGIKVIMVTGDHPRTALAIARQIGLVQSDKPVILNGEQLHRMSNTQLQLALDAEEILFARVTADQKMRIVHALKRKKEVVAVTGDGVNDAPALKAADIGIAMGLCGTDVAKESADMILLDDNFATIVAAIEEGRAVYDNIRKFLTYILSSNIPELMPYLAFALFKIPLPLTIIQILAIDLGTDMVPALGLGVERPDPDIMKRPPRPRKERLLDWGLLARSYLFLGMLEAGASMAAFFYVLRQAGWQGEMLDHHAPLYLQATTATLVAIILMQIMNLMLCRSQSRSIFGTRTFPNFLMLVGIALEILIAVFISYTPWGNEIFGTAPLEWQAWLYIIPFMFGMLALEEVRKWVVRNFFAPS